MVQKIKIHSQTLISFRPRSMSLSSGNQTARTTHYSQHNLKLGLTTLLSSTFSTPTSTIITHSRDVDPPVSSANLIQRHLFNDRPTFKELRVLLSILLWRQSVRE